MHLLDTMVARTGPSTGIAWKYQAEFDFKDEPV